MSDCLENFVLGDFVLEDVPPNVFVQTLSIHYFQDAKKGDKQFNRLRKQLTVLLSSAPSPGPAVYVEDCLSVILTSEIDHGAGVCHLLLTALQLFDGNLKSDLEIARASASSLFLHVIAKDGNTDPRVLCRIINVFGIHIENLRDSFVKMEEPNRAKLTQSLPLVHKKEENGYSIEEILQGYIKSLISCSVYTHAVALMKQLGIIEDLDIVTLDAMLSEGLYDQAADWAKLLGKGKCELVVISCREKGFFKAAHTIVQKCGVAEKFPDSFALYRKSSLKKLASRGLWDIAGSLTEGDKSLQKYLVELALAEGEIQKALLLSSEYGMEDLMTESELQRATIGVQQSYCRVEDFISRENLMWVDSEEGLRMAARHLAASEHVGVDAEWKPNRERGKSNKVSILQLASASHAFVLDVLFLAQNKPRGLALFLEAVFHNPKTLKLGFSLRSDLCLLSRSFPEVSAFQRCEPIRELQSQTLGSAKVKGGLSELANRVLGKPLNKVSRMTNWEQRPITARQMDYAALDALCLVKIYEKLRSNIVNSQFSSFLFQNDAKMSTEKLETQKQSSGGVSLVTRKEKFWQTRRSGLSLQKRTRKESKKDSEDSAEMVQQWGASKDGPKPMTDATEAPSNQDAPPVNSCARKGRKRFRRKKD